MLAIPEILCVGLLAVGPVQPEAVSEPQTSQVPVVPHDRVEVIAASQTIRGRIAEVTFDRVVVDTNDGRIAIPLRSIQRINRVGDSLANGTAIGAALGGASALGLMAKLCSNNNCSDISASLDPRFTLMGTLIGAGIGALIDGVIERRTSVYRAGGDAPPLLGPEVQPPARGAREVMIFGRAGRAQLSDDEGSLGGGQTWGGGIRVPIGHRIGVQVGYDHETRRREFEFGRTFSGTDKLFTGKVLWFFRTNKYVRPYAGLGLGILDSHSTSFSPTWTLGPRNQVVQGPPEMSRSRSRSTVVGFAAGADIRLLRHLALLGDLTLDLGGHAALASTRVTVGAGWRF